MDAEEREHCNGCDGLQGSLWGGPRPCQWICWRMPGDRKYIFSTKEPGDPIPRPKDRCPGFRPAEESPSQEGA